jgi:nucleoside-triphosphatase THEP1
MIVYLPQKPLSEKWMKASVVGSLWAVTEIVFGSLLHNLKIPFAGSILSFFTVFLVIAFFQLWNVKGMIWRAGLICALMKSLSPSAFILGPMLGIITEAVIMEIVIRCLGNNVISYVVGGALSVFSALVHKAISLLILYGWDIVVLLEKMCLWATSQLRIEELKPSYLLLIISAIYLSSGALAGILGFKSGQNFKRNREPGQINHYLKNQAQSNLFKYTRKENHSLLLLLLIFVFLVGSMIFMNRTSLLVSAIFSIIFTIFIALRYTQNMRYLKKPAFWLQLLTILLFSAVFYKGFSFDGIFHSEGWIIGLKMVFRAMVMLAAFSAISRELKNPIIKNILYNRELKNLYRSLELAFSALPELMEDFSTLNSKEKGFRKLVYTMLGRSQSLLDGFMSLEKNQPMIFVICGEVHKGKTTIAKKVVADLQENDLTVSGLISESEVNESGQKTYFTEDIISGAREMLCSENQLPGGFKSGRFNFSEKGVNHGHQILERTLNEPTNLVVIDEIGPLEINNKGWAPAIEQLLIQNNTPQLWIVREELLNIVLRKWNIGDVYIFNIETTTAQQIAKCITKNLIIKQTDIKNEL